MDTPLLFVRSVFRCKVKASRERLAFCIRIFFAGII